jgi:hypothetical protein
MWFFCVLVKSSLLKCATCTSPSCFCSINNCSKPSTCWFQTILHAEAEALGQYQCTGELCINGRLFVTWHSMPVLTFLQSVLPQNLLMRKSPSGVCSLSTPVRSRRGFNSASLICTCQVVYPPHQKRGKVAADARGRTSWSMRSSGTVWITHTLFGLSRSCPVATCSCSDHRSGIAPKLLCS